MIQAVRLLPIAFIFTASVTLMDSLFNDEVGRLSSIRQDFTRAVSETRGRLTAGVWSVLLDDQIGQNLTMGNMNTVSQSLQGYLRPGEISQIDLYDANCNLLARAPQSAKTSGDICQAVKSGKPALMWFEGEQGEPLLMSTASKQTAGQTIYAVGQLAFDQTWLSLNHRLANLVADRDISISSAGGAVLWKDGLKPNGQSALVLRVDGWLYRIIPDLTGISLQPVRERFWLLYGALGVVMLLAISEVSARARKDQIERSQFESWVLGQSSTKAAGSQPAAPLAQTWAELLSSAQSILASRDEQKAQQLRLMSERFEAVSNRLREREVEMAELNDRISEMSDLASLQQQLRHTTSSFLRQMAQIREMCETIYDVASDGLSRQAKELKVFCARWKDGVSQGTGRDMAARKFFRSLVETQGKTPGSSQLDDDLRNLESLTTVALDQSLHVAMLAKKALNDCESSSQMALLWHGIAVRDQSVKSPDWIKSLAAAQKLVNADDRFKSVEFQMLPQLGNPEEVYPSVSSSALVSGFFHLYLALLSDTDPSILSAPMVVRQKRSNEQGTIILSLPARQTVRANDCVSRQMMYHVDIARKLLSACGLKVAVLPPTVAGHPVGISWMLPSKTPATHLSSNTTAMTSSADPSQSV